MKPKNFPVRKLIRQINAKHGAQAALLPEYRSAIESERAVRTKKRRGQ